MLNNTVNLVGAIVLVVYVIVATALGSLQWLEKYPTLKKFVEPKAVRAILLIVAIILLFGVFQNINAVREALNVPPPAPKVPPAPIFEKQGPTPNLARGAVPKPDSKPPVQVNSAPNGIAIGGGNVTSPTVNNFGPTERHLNTNQIQALGVVAASLSEDSPSWFFIETINNTESSNLASEIKNVFGNKAGGVVTRMVENTPIPKGVFVIVSGRDSEHFDIAQKIANALGDSVFLTRFELATGLNSRQVKIVVESD